MNVAVRTEGDPRASAPAVREVLRELDRAKPAHGTPRARRPAGRDLRARPPAHAGARRVRGRRGPAVARRHPRRAAPPRARADARDRHPHGARREPRARRRPGSPATAAPRAVGLADRPGARPRLGAAVSGLLFGVGPADPERACWRWPSCPCPRSSCRSIRPGARRASTRPRSCGAGSAGRTALMPRGLQAPTLFRGFPLRLLKALTDRVQVALEIGGGAVQPRIGIATT